MRLLQKMKPLSMEMACIVSIVLDYPIFCHFDHQVFLGRWMSKHPSDRYQVFESSLLRNMAKQSRIVSHHVLNSRSWWYSHIQGFTDICKRDNRQMQPSRCSQSLGGRLFLCVINEKWEWEPDTLYKRLHLFLPKNALILKCTFPQHSSWN